MEISIKQFEQLSKIQLYTLLQLRQRVFIQEQQSIYDDIDGEDLDALHVMLEEGPIVAGYARFRQLKQSNKVLIERVVLAPQARGTGAGRQIMLDILDYCSTHFPQGIIQLSAQVDVLTFYEKLGFKTQGDAYDDGGILHKTMILQE